jgi:hypothetical protein
MPRKYEPGWFAEVERTLHAKMMGIEREMLACPIGRAHP